MSELLKSIDPKQSKARAYPLSYAQQRLWFLEQLEPATAAYNIPCALRMEGDLNISALKRSLNEIVRRHETLRSNIVVHKGAPLLRIAPATEPALDEADLSDLPEDRRYDEARRLMGAMARTAFDLARAPLIRVSLFRLGESDHVLLVVMHHIVSDGWSLGVMVREFSELYGSYAGGRPSPLEDLKIQYLDYTIWQRNWLKGEQLAEQLSFWRMQLADIAELDWHSECSLTCHEKAEGAVVECDLSEAISHDLNQLGRREGATLFMTLLAAFQILLGRYCGENDIAIGTPVAGRRSAETEALIGFFVNTLVVRTRLDTALGFLSLLSQVRDTTIAVYTHQDVPFEKIVEDLQPKRNLNRTPFFQAMLILQNMPETVFELPGLKLSEIEVDSGAPKFDLKLTAIEVNGGIRAKLEYRTDLFTETRVRRLLDYWQNLLAEIVRHPQEPLRNLSLLTEAEREQILAAWNSALESPQPNVFDVFDAQAAHTPDAIAMEYGRQRVTYDELRRQTNTIAANLQHAGAKAGDLVLIFSADRRAIVEAMIGILKAGCGFVPVLPGLPDARASDLLSQCTPAWAIIDAGLEARFEQLKAGFCRQISTAPGHSEFSEPSLPRGRNGNELSYIYFTSGSTGKPKAIAGRLKGINHFIRWEIEEFEIGPECRAAQLTSPMFDPILRDVFVPLCSGGTLCVPSDPDLVLDGSGLAQWLVEQHITLMHTVPSVFRLMVNQSHGHRFSELKHMLLAGEPVLPADAGRWYESEGTENSRLVNLYGPSETTMVKFRHRVQKEDSSWRAVRIGTPIPGAAAITVDEAGAVCPPGIAGEIYIRTPYSSLGYYRQPELTAKVFVPNPFHSDPHDIVYKTGDIGRVLEDGTFMLLGRRDHQVKVRGVRIELEEIEAALNECDGVAAAAVAVREGESGEKSLVAYVTARGGSAIHSGDLRRSLKKRLPDAMIPAAFTVLEQMPLLPNGKVNRKVLPEAEAGGSSPDYVAPQTVEEEILCGIWADILKRQQVGVEDNFFEIGGHSLLAMNVIARIRSAFETELPLRALFEDPTVRGVARALMLARSQGKTAAPRPVARPAGQTVLPLSFAQQRLWFFEQANPGNAAYNIPIALRLKGDLDLKALRKSFDEIVRRHEALRTSFVMNAENQPEQRVHDAGEASLLIQKIGLEDLPAERREAEARRLAQRETEQGFDLTRVPLLRVQLITMAAQDYVMLLTLHHIISDGWSMGVLVEEFLELYQAEREQRPARVKPLAVQYGDYTLWQREWLQGVALEEQLGYWKKQLAGIEPLELPTDHPGQAGQDRLGAAVPVHLDAALTKDLDELGRREGVTSYMVLLAGLQILLARYTGRQDVAVGTPVANRTHAEIERLIGFFVNTLVLRGDVKGCQTVRDLLQQTRKTALEAYAHQDLPFERLVEEIHPERHWGQDPIIQVIFTLQDFSAVHLQLPGLSFAEMEVEKQTAKFDLAWSLTLTGSEIVGRVEYNSRLFDRQRMERMAGHWTRLLSLMAHDSGQRIGSLELLTPAERQQVVEDWNNTNRGDPLERTVAELFEEEVQRDPEATAVTYDAQRLSYRELNERANQLGHYLRSLGVRPEIPVALCLERSLELIVGIVGVVKAGGVYVPLDPGYPAERVIFMLKDTGATLLLTQQKLLPIVGDLPVTRICLDTDWPAIAQYAKTNPPCLNVSESAFYVMYTSGSTGRPKGIVTLHRCIVLSVKAVDYAAFGPNEVMLQFAPTTFDVSTLEIWSSLLHGGRVAVFSSGTASLRELGRFVAEQNVSSLFMTAGLFAQMVEQELESLRNVRQLITGGDVVSPAHAARLREQVSSCVLMNGYGPTETTIICTCYRVPGPGDIDGPLPIGTPITNSQTYVLDEEMQPAPVGVAGELYIGGGGLARGYLNAPDVTAARYLPNPFAGHLNPGSRLYRSGDKAYWGWDGNLAFLGRLDQQVKIRGFRVEPGEIEAALLENPELAQAAVVVREDDAGDKRLVAYVVSRSPGAQVDFRSLQKALAEKLPAWMVPSAWMQLDALPLTHNGKVDQKSLPRPERAADESEDYGPRNAEEEILCGILARVLKLERVGPRQDFFELGGHSLLATQVVARIRETFGAELTLRSFFERPTAAGLARELMLASGRDQGKSDRPPIEVRQRPGVQKDDLPLSFAQERLWFIQQLEPGSASYNVPIGFRLKGTLDKEVLRKSLNEIVRRHESLRTIFPVIDGKAVQKILEFIPPEIAEVELSDAELSEAGALALARQEAETPFDLARGPLVRVKLLCMGPDEHILLATMHHIVSDGWSLMVLQREFTRLYEAYAKGESSPLEELKIQYGNYSVWQRNWLRGEVLEEKLGYWRKQLADVPALELATDKPRPPVLSESAADVALEIGEHETGALRRLARQENATLFMVLLAALDTLLWRYSGQSDIAIGAPIANRSGIETEALIGFFVNSLVLRSEVRGRDTARGLLARVRQTTLEAYRYQDVPFEKVVEDLQPQRDLGRMPLFQVALVLQNFSRQQFSLPALEVSSFEPAQAAAKTELRFLLVDEGSRLQGSITYAVDLFEPATIARMADHWKHLLAEFIAHSEETLSRLSMMDEAERTQILEVWSAGEEREFWKGGIVAQFARQAALGPEAPAVIWDDGRISYREMAQRVWKTGRYLRELGVKPENAVGVCLEPGAELMIAFFAVIAAGAVIVPLDPDYPAERLTYMLQDTAPAVVLTRSCLRDRIPIVHTKLAMLDHAADVIAAHDDSVLETDVSPDNLLYVVFTSGSTGRPKGVAVSQGAMVSRAQFLAQRYGSQRTDRSLQVLSAAFDAFGGGLYSTLLTGGALVFTRPERLLSPQEMCNVIAEAPVTTLRVAVGYLRELLIYAVQKGIVLPPSLRLIITGGETISRTEMRDWLKRAAPHARFIHEYGPTETTVTAGLYEEDLQSEFLAHAHRSLIGRPNANTQLYVLGEEMEAAATGVTGEVYIGGASLARCYTGTAEQTAERFVPNPVAGGGRRLYRTGDWGRWLADGTLEFLGRRDDQVKVRGYRIELGEIEAVLRLHPAIRDVAVIVRDDARHGKRLVGYVVAEATPAPAATELRRFLEEKLPEYMVPAAFVELAELPYMAGGGKLDRKRLPEPPEEAHEAKAPRTPTEEILCGIWSEVLKQDRVGVDDNFFALGGHSLLATQVMARVRRAFGMELPLRVLFEAQTAEALAERIEQRKQAGDSAPAPLFRHVSREAPLPLSYAQQRLWFLDQLEPGSAAYNIPVAVRLKGELKIEVLKCALNEIVRRHEVLRTSFAIVDGEARQVIVPADADHSAILIEMADFAGMEQVDAETEMQRRVRVESATPFNLSQGPLLRLRLFRLGPAEHVLLAVMHHIASDGWSQGIMVREFATLYQAYAEGRKSPLPELPFQYADYAVWQREWLQGELPDGQLAYWKEQLADVPALELLTDHPRSESVAGSGLHLILPQHLSEGLKRLARSEGATLFMTMLAGFQLLLARYASQDDIAVGTPIAGRRWAETEDMIGFFVNTLVLRVRIDSKASFTELLAQTREKTLDAYAHQDLPFEKLVEELQPERHLGRTPLFQVMFALQNAPQSELQLPALTMSNIDIESKIARFDLMLMAAEAHGEIHAGLSYRADWFDESSVRRMLSHWENLLASILENERLEIRNLSMLSAAERGQILEEWNRTETEYPKRFVHQLVEDQAAASPGAVAVESGTQELTYAGLNRQANQLARYLAKHGVAAESRVALCMERSPDLMVGMLGILKAGAAYVPLDPRYPPSRLAFMLEDSRIDVLVTQRDFQTLFTGLVKTVLCLDSLKQEIGRLDPSNLAVAVDGDNLAYVLYTSGSTGEPKGVGMPHGPLANLLHWQGARAPEGRPLRTVQFTAATFDVSFQEIFSTWSQGGSLVLIDEETRRDPYLLWGTLLKKQIERLFLPFVALEQLAEAADISERRAGLREVITAGEQLRITPAIAALFRVLPGCVLENHYGPTESHVVTAHRLERDISGWPVLPSIGRAIANAQLYLLDEVQEPVPAGVAGEVFLGGLSLARGYIGNSRLTAEKFIPDPFSKKPGRRLYRTGDLARRFTNGDLEFLGRKDRQVKVRGYRIELGEIETALSGCPGVAQSAVTMREDRPGEKRLVAYVIPRPQEILISTSLTARLRDILPEYMVPSAFVELEKFLLTSSGKIDRGKLPAPIEDQVPDAVMPPQTMEEEVLCGIWAEVLKKERIGRNDHFFALGGHSLLATKLIMRARRAFQMDLPVRGIFENPTVAGLAEYIRKLKLSHAGVTLPPILRVRREELLPVSYSQQRLWFLDHLEAGRQVYNLSAILRLQGTLRIEVLHRAIEEIIRRHEVLRTTFVSAEGQPWQSVSPLARLPFEFMDLTPTPEGQRDLRVRELAREEALRPFDLAQGPVLRGALYRLREDEHVFCITVHHIAFDGGSVPVFLHELAALYGAFLHDRPSPLPELPLQYADFAAWERAWLQGEVLERHLRYWRTRLEGCPQRLELPFDFPRPPVQTFRGGTCSLLLPSEFLLSLKRLSLAQGVTEYMTILALIDIWLFHYSGQRDIVIGSPVANRNQPEIEGGIGFFVNTLAIRTRIDPEAVFIELLESIRTSALEDHVHGALPFEMLVDELRLERDASRNPLFQMMFNMENETGAKLELEGVEIEPMRAEMQLSRYDLYIVAVPRRTGLELNCIYSTDLFRPATIENMLSSLGELMRRAVEDPHARIAGLTLQLAQFERERALLRRQEQSRMQMKGLHSIRRRVHGESPQ